MRRMKRIAQEKQPEEPKDLVEALIRLAFANKILGESLQALQPRSLRELSPRVLKELDTIVAAVKIIAPNIDGALQHAAEELDHRYWEGFASAVIITGRDDLLEEFPKADAAAIILEAEEIIGMNPPPSSR